MSLRAQPVVPNRKQSPFKPMPDLLSMSNLKEFTYDRAESPKSTDHHRP